MSEATVFATVITSTEWRSLLGLGELRIARRRVQEIRVPPTSKERDRLFAWGPTTVVGDGNDVIVLELSDDWVARSVRHPAQPSELTLLPRGAILAHHAVGSEFHTYLSGDAEKEGVELAQGRYDQPWNEWVDRTHLDHELSAARELLAALAIEWDLTQKRPDGYSWSEVIRLARNGKSVVKSKPKHIESILRSVRAISDSVAGVQATAAYDVAVNIEWVSTRLGKDAFAKTDLRVALETALESGRDLGWSRNGVDCSPCESAIALLVERFPRAYTEEITPLVVSTLARLVMAAKDRTLDPIDLATLVSRLRDQNLLAAATVCASVAGALGPILTRRLVRSVASVNLLPIDWS